MLSRTGRRPRNEDACGYLVLEGRACFVVADGAGGHGCGDVAARTAVKAVLGALGQRPEDLTQAAMTALRAAQAAIRQGQEADPACADMRSTLVVLILGPRRDQAGWGHVGDSRLYGFRDGCILHQTRDHSLYESMIAAGLATEGERRGNPARNVLFASLGGDEDFDPEVVSEVQPVHPGDAFLLCTDGFWDHVTETQMMGCLQRAATVQGWLDEMTTLIEASARGHRHQDNFSGLALWIGRRDAGTLRVGWRGRD